MFGMQKIGDKMESRDFKALLDVLERIAKSLELLVKIQTIAGGVTILSVKDENNKSKK